MKTFNTLDDLKIIPFLKIMQEGNVLLLDSEYTTEKNYTDEEITQLNELWLKLYDEYFELKNDGLARTYLTNQHKVFNLEFKIVTLSKFHDILANIQEYQHNEKVAEIKLNCVNEVKKLAPRLKINIFDDVLTLCTKIQGVIKALTNELGTIKVNQEKRVEKQKANVYDVVANVEQVLERSLGDINNISVALFVSYEKIAGKIIKSKENKNIKK